MYFRFMEIKGDQVASKQCIMVAIKQNPLGPKRKGKVVVECSKVLQQLQEEEDVRLRSTHEPFEPCEELESVLSSSDPEKYFKIGCGLDATERSELINFLVGNLDIFAWDPYEVPGVDPNFIQHQLNVDPQSKPIQRRARRAAPIHTEVVQQEVEKLLQVGAMQELQYPIWLSNTMVVKKNNAKWMAYVDFTDLNQVYLKDHFPLPKIDLLVDPTASHNRMSFLDILQGYHQVVLLPEDERRSPS